ncbi:MAG: NAD(P)/FAD-dependent oxidoreductase [Candidatus Izemoplasmatales bacterium]|nr:NAD(P)/FAD-dependent oxidoreductase [bacterium]MDZ4196573.1 NAD(P)/FAD-dependent oxidoreductase [Candidatus Izemoplasmatales bacterium]
MFDVLIVGGGPAGISAAVYLKRFRLNIVIIMKDYGTLAKTDHIENYYGFVEPITGTQLVENGINQAKRMGISIIEEEVLNIEYFDTFTVKTNKSEYLAKTVLLTTGASRSGLKVKGFNDYVGKGISYCAVCDGFIYRNKRIGVVGAGEFMLEEYEVLKNFTNELTVFTNGVPLSVDIHGATLVSEPITAILGDEQIRQVKTSLASYDVDALFVAIGTPSASDFALRMGAFLKNNDIEVDETFMTNIPGLFAAGDCIGGFYQIAKAVSDGAHASVAINKYLRQKASL